MKQHYDVTGMTCSACAAHVETAARSVPGVTEAQVNLFAQLNDLRTGGRSTDGTGHCGGAEGGLRCIRARCGSKAAAQERMPGEEGIQEHEDTADRVAVLQ